MASLSPAWAAEVLSKTLSQNREQKKGEGGVEDEAGCKGPVIKSHVQREERKRELLTTGKIIQDWLSTMEHEQQKENV